MGILDFLTGEFILDRVGQYLSGPQVAITSQVVVGRFNTEPEPVGGRFDRLHRFCGDLDTDSVAGDNCQPVGAHTCASPTVSVITC